MSTEIVVADRPTHGEPRPYHFPRFERFRLANGLTVLHAHVPGRALIAANLLIPGGGWTEPPEQGGVTVLTSQPASPLAVSRRSAAATWATDDTV